MRILINVLLALFGIFILIQFIRPAKNQHRPPFPDDITRSYAIPQEVQTILQQACYDCHSNNTTYPWYAEVQPFGWFLAHHVEDGKKELNFHEYAAYSARRQRNKLKRMKEQIREDKMPLQSYTWMHANAKLTEQQKAAVYRWIDEILNTGDKK